MDRGSQLDEDDKEDEEEEDEAGGGRRQEAAEGGRGGGRRRQEATDIKSNNPHLAGGEKNEKWEKQKLSKRTIGTARTTQNAVKTNAKRPKNNKNATAFFERWSNY